MRACVSGHFGEWVQGRIGASGPIGVVTLPCPVLSIEVERRKAGALVLDDPVQYVSPDTADRFLNAIGGVHGTYRIRGNMPPGGGAGASTAALVALARASSGAEDDLPLQCVRAEGASDPLMLDAPDRVLWAPREGRKLSKVAALPPVSVIGGFLGDPVRTDPQDVRFPDVEDLAMEFAVPLSAARLARIAAESAARTSAMRGPVHDPIVSLARDVGALGYVRAHTGSARGLIFSPGEVPKGAKSALEEAGFAQIIAFDTGHRP